MTPRPVYMPFGKWKGQPVTELPASYLRWLDGLPDLREPLRGAVRAERARRARGRVPRHPALEKIARPPAASPVERSANRAPQPGRAPVVLSADEWEAIVARLGQGVGNA